MIDVFLKTHSPIADIPSALAGFTCDRIMVRDTRPTQVWQRTENGWQPDQAWMTLYEDLASTLVELHAYVYKRVGVTSDLVDDGMTLQLNEAEAAEWLTAMATHRYTLEDAIGCSVDADHGDATIECASAIFPVSVFKDITNPKTPLGRKILAWIDQAVAAGADQIGATISKRATAQR